MQVARVYNDAMNIIHYMHDKYYYEKLKWRLSIPTRALIWHTV